MDISIQLQKQLIDATKQRQTLHIIGNNSKAFYGCSSGNEDKASPLHVTDHNGIIDYQPAELTITARTGTLLRDIINLLEEHQQMLPFEPPTFNDNATLGGCIATALAGPRRPWTGPVRDYVIGAHILTGDGRDIRLGSKVMKNVAGYDLFRPMAGALGTLGLILDVTLKLLPRPEQEITLCMMTDTRNMQKLLHKWRRHSMPLSAASFFQGQLFIRLSGAASSIDDAMNKLPSEMKRSANDHWHKLNEQQLGFFDSGSPLYRLVVPAGVPYDTFNGEYLADWGGALRWIKTSLSFGEIQKHAAGLGGTASVYRNGKQSEDVFSPLPDGLFELHKRIKKVMDPAGILNPGRLYRNL
jgi:glycolate oxidase FAD binding subunit